MDLKEFFKENRRKILYYILERGEVTSMELAEEFDLHPVTASIKLRRLHKNGWINRRWITEGGYHIYSPGSHLYKWLDSY